MGDTDFYGRVGELESLQDAYDSRIAEMAIIYGHRLLGELLKYPGGQFKGRLTAIGVLEKRHLFKNSVKGNPPFSTQRKHGKIRTNWIVFLRLWEHFAEIRNCAISNGLRRSGHLRLSRHRLAR